MATTPYNLRTRLNGQTPTLRSTPTGSPSNFKSGARSPRKAQPASISLQLQHVIGTTTTSPPGLACCARTNTYAYCAGSVAVLAEIQADGKTKKRYYRARPTTASVNPSIAHYSADAVSSTPSRRRTSIFAPNRSRGSETSVAREYDEGGSQTWTARERIKTISCVALSEDGKWLAIGETGYSPRVLLYALGGDASTDTPISIIPDHTIGIKCVAFSPDGKYLATLGNLNDGFIFVWSINSRTGQLSLHAANKCTTTVYDMTWCGQSVITAGTRHVKVWSINEGARSTPTKRTSTRASMGRDLSQPGPATLVGHNALLASLVDCTFTAATTIDSRTVLLATDAGHLCIFQPDGPSDVQVLKVYDAEISTIAWQPTSGKVVLGGRQGLVYEEYDALLAAFHARKEKLNQRSEKRRARSSAVRMSLSLQSGNSIGIAAVTCLAEHTVSLDTDGNLQTETATEESNRPTVTFASHSDLIQGVQTLPPGYETGDFYTWSRRGDIKFWDTSGDMLHSMHVETSMVEKELDGNPNELRVAKLDVSRNQFILGDRIGVLQVVACDTGIVDWTGRAHGAEINDIDVHEDKALTASCGRDRSVQLFSVKSRGLHLLQTMDDHIGAVNHVKFSKDGERLLSCSADRTIIVRDCVRRINDGEETSAYLSMRVVTMKSAPLSMAFISHDSVILSTHDRHLATVDLVAGMVTETVKLTDPENDDTVSLSTIHYSARMQNGSDVMDLILGCSPTDKSIRVYDGRNCSLVTRESGHTEGVSGLCLIEGRHEGSGSISRKLVSTGLDGTIMIWNVSTNPFMQPSCGNDQTPTQKASVWAGDSTPSKASPAAMAPLRKILSKMEVLEFVQANGLPSPGSTRSLSPPRLTRKQSSLVISSIAEEGRGQKACSEPMVSGSESTAVERSENKAGALSSSTQLITGGVDAIVDHDQHGRRSHQARSPSPQRLESASTPSTPRRSQAQANNGRLRRPPSIPGDLRERALTQRRRSMSQASEFGSMGMATEQATRMLKIYRKKLVTSQEDLELGELEAELENVMRLVQERKIGPIQSKSLNGTLRKSKGKSLMQPSESEMDDLAVLLVRTNLAERSPRMQHGDDGMKT